jgi:hypothetical protein
LRETEGRLMGAASSIETLALRGRRGLMSVDGVLKINHRELILSSAKKAKFGFLRLPHSLQDSIIEGFDGGTTTLDEASQCALQCGFKLSHTAIATYYEAVRRRRANLLVRLTT